MSFELNDLGFARIQKELKQLDKQKVDIGLLGKSGQDVVNVGFWNEFGTANIPPRSFIQSTSQEQKNNVSKLLVNGLKGIYAGNTTVNAQLNIVGLFMETKIKKKITDLKIPPNAPETIKKKKSSNPLIDTGRMRASVAYEVRRK